MKTKEFEFKIEKKEVDINSQEKERVNDKYIDDLKYLLTTNSTVPTHIPRKWYEQFWLYKNGADYKLYIYINNEWKSVTLS